MKHLLTGVAVGAALAIAAPVWAQNPASNPGPCASAIDEPYASRRERDVGEGLRVARASPTPRCAVGGEVVCR